ncbi:MAG: hypothetical protein NPIRA02_17820 [Nitrospirales bacterium]|nr:MAG: hypothetical protein NPIRA02_17820 [Nitrospirales bacterium]
MEGGYAQTTETSTQLEEALFQSYGPYELPIPEVANVKLIFKTDLDVVIPEFQSYSKSDPALLKYMASGSEATVEYFSLVLEQTGWGHIVPYLYAATYHFLGRIYYGISSSPGLADGTPLLPKKTLTAGKISIRVVSDSKVWQAYLRRIGHSSAVAYWDPLRAEVGVYVNKSMFREAAYQAKWTGRTTTENVGRLESYVARLVIRDLGHELFHAIQQRTPSRIYKFPLLSEASALYAQHNAFMRGEIVKLSKMLFGISRHPSFDNEKYMKCIGSASEFWRGDYFTVGEIHRAHEYVHYRPEFSLTEILSMQPGRFYGVESTELSYRYAIAHSIYWFLTRANRETLHAWNRVLSSLSEEERLDMVEKEATEVDIQYRAWLERLANRWWSNPNARHLFLKAKKETTYCLNAMGFAIAWQKAVESAAYMPGNPTSSLYLGDLYWRIGNYHIASEYYAIANKVAEPERFGEAPSRLKSRLADAAEQLGNIELAVNLYKEVSEMPLEHPEYFLVFNRSRLKYEYYRHTKHKGTWLTEESRLKLNTYIRELQSPANKLGALQFLERKDWRSYIDLLSKQYNKVLSRMLVDLGVKRGDAP